MIFKHRLKLAWDLIRGYKNPYLKELTPEEHEFIRKLIWDEHEKRFGARCNINMFTATDLIHTLTNKFDYYPSEQETP